MFAFGHLIFAWIIGLFFQLLSRKKISRLGWGVLFFGAILPDVDFLFGFILNENIHRGFTHSFVFVLLSFFIVYLILKNFNLEKNAIFISLGVLTHIFADLFQFPGVLLFWPFGTWFSIFGMANNVNVYSLSFEFLSKVWLSIFLDSTIGLIWLIYLYFKGDIKLS